MTGPSPFPLRGLKGLWWEPEQYRDWPDLLAEAGYDLFMLCYTFCPETSLAWRQPLREPEIELIRRLSQDCRARGITLCLALHPLIGGQAWAPESAGVRFHPTSGRGWFQRYWQARRPGESLQPDPPIRYGSDEDLVLLIEKCRVAQSLGVESIALCLDDVEPGSSPVGFPSLAAAHLWLANGLRDNLTPGGRNGSGRNELRPYQDGHVGAQFIAPTGGEVVARLFVVPTYYWTEGARAHADYTAELSAGLPPDVEIFWTGEVVRDHAITPVKAREAAGLLGRKPLVWLNYASNDSFRFLIQLPPDQPPSPDLAPETAGLLLNSTRQVGLARLDALIIGRYLANPTAYLHHVAVVDAVTRLVGEAAASLLIELVYAWQAVPDVRTLTHDLQAGGRPFLAELQARLSPALATVDRVRPALNARLTDRQLWTELAAGVERLHFLVDALAVLAAELDAAGSDAIGPAAVGTGQGRFSPARAGLLARLASADPESACDAEAVLSLGPR